MSPLEPSVVAPSAPAPQVHAPVHVGTGGGTTAPDSPAVTPAGEQVFSRRTPLSPGPAAPAAAARAPRVGVDWVSWATTSLVLVALFVLVVSGRVVTEGPVVMVLSATHGIHLGDLYALTATCGAMAVPVLRGLRRR